MNVFEQIKQELNDCKEQSRDVFEIVERVEKEHNNGWIPVGERIPYTNDYILLSFSNFTIPVVGRYETEKDGSGAFYVGDELETCLSQDLFVNAWMQLPEPYKECEKE